MDYNSPKKIFTKIGELRWASVCWFEMD